MSTLSYGSPSSVGLLEKPLLDLEVTIADFLTPRNYGAATFNQVHPIYPGATVLIACQSTIVSHFAVGHSLKYADANGTELPSSEWVKTEKDTIYDIASLTKMFTTILVLQELEKPGSLSLNATVATYLPDFAVHGKENITIFHLLTHTSGLLPDPEPPLWIGYSTYWERRNAIVATKPVARPGEQYTYSDINFMTLQLLLEKVTGQALDTLVQDKITIPLGMKNTWFNKNNLDLSNSSKYPLVAATEFEIAGQGELEPSRPQPVRASVHDENSWALNGVAGHAGLFSTAIDLSIFCQMILNNGTYGSVKILEPSSVDKIFFDYNAEAFPDWPHGLGFELDRKLWSGRMKSLTTAGHTGFCGVSMAMDRPTNTLFLLLSNRVHPVRTWSSPNIAREAVGDAVALALGR